ALELLDRLDLESFDSVSRDGPAGDRDGNVGQAGHAVLDGHGLALEHHVQKAVVGEEARGQSARDAGVRAGRVLGVADAGRDVAVDVDDRALESHLDALLFSGEEATPGDEGREHESDDGGDDELSLHGPFLLSRGSVGGAAAPAHVPEVTYLSGAAPMT